MAKQVGVLQHNWMTNWGGEENFAQGQLHSLIPTWPSYFLECHCLTLANALAHEQSMQVLKDEMLLHINQIRLQGGGGSECVGGGGGKGDRM